MCTYTREAHFWISGNVLYTLKFAQYGQIGFPYIAHWAARIFEDVRCSTMFKDVLEYPGIWICCDGACRLDETRKFGSLMLRKQRHSALTYGYLIREHRRTKKSCKKHFCFLVPGCSGVSLEVPIFNPWRECLRNVRACTGLMWAGKMSCPARIIVILVHHPCYDESGSHFLLEICGSNLAAYACSAFPLLLSWHCVSCRTVQAAGV